MDSDDYLVALLQNLVPIETLEKIADAQAFELWGENIGRGEPMPLADASGSYAYISPYILNARQYPSTETVFGQVRSLRSRYKVVPAEDNLPAAYYTELRQLGNGYGCVCVAASYTDTPILWMSHFLAPYYLTGESAKEEAKRRLGDEIRLRKYYSPQKSNTWSSPQGRTQS
jgi:hypothetical protein